MPRIALRRAARVALVSGLAAAALVAPPHAQAQFGGLGQKLGAKVLGDRTGKARGFPPGFSDPRYEITTARLDGILRGLSTYEAAVARVNAANEAQQAKRDRVAHAEAAEGRKQFDAMQPYMLCVLQANKAGAEVPASDPRRPKVDALVQHMQVFGAELERRSSTGQPLDTAAALRRQTGMLDSLALLTIGRRCPPMPKAMLTGDSPAAEESGGQSTGGGPVYPDRDAIIQREAQVDAQQIGVMCDKIVAYFGAVQRRVEPAGFGAGELEALRARSDELRRRGGSLCSGMP